MDKDAVEFLGLHITFAHGRKTDYALSLNLAMYQKVTLARDPNLKTTADTWSGESVLLTPPKLLDDAISNTVNQLVDQFVDAYLSANPK